MTRATRLVGWDLWNEVSVVLKVFEGCENNGIQKSNTLCSHVSMEMKNKDAPLITIGYKRTFVVNLRHNIYFQFPPIFQLDNRDGDDDVWFLLFGIEGEYADSKIPTRGKECWCNQKSRSRRDCAGQLSKERIFGRRWSNSGRMVIWGKVNWTNAKRKEGAWRLLTLFEQS